MGTFNQRSISEILEMVFVLGRVLGCEDKARSLVNRLVANLQAISASARQFPHRPRIFFEEWKDPLISGIRWVEELIEIAGGEATFPELRGAGQAKDRIVAPDVVRERNPDIIIASWCGMNVNTEAIRARAPVGTQFMLFASVTFTKSNPRLYCSPVPPP
jgi:iron complex transport system substrate-binding protein